MRTRQAACRVSTTRHAGAISSPMTPLRNQRESGGYRTHRDDMRGLRSVTRWVESGMSATRPIPVIQRLARHSQKQSLEGR